MPCDLEAGVTIQYASLGSWMLVLTLANGIQLAARLFANHHVAHLPLAFQRFLFFAGLNFFVSDLLTTNSSFFTFTIWSVNCFVSMVGSYTSAILLSYWVYETTRTAYLTIYFESKTLPRWPFIGTATLSCVAALISFVLRVYFNQNRFLVILLVPLSAHFLCIVVFLIYFGRKLVIAVREQEHAFQLRSPSTRTQAAAPASSGLTGYWRFVIIASCFLLGLVCTTMLEVVDILQASSVLFFDVTRDCHYQFQPSLVLRDMCVTIGTMWAWKSFPCRASHAVIPQISGMMEPVSGRHNPSPSQTPLVGEGGFMTVKGRSSSS
eukprot:TRINITY_DN17367_c0_g2_i1.p1 TRINITY_DN17367_c0_g2~~TRINITY_DN17367_c0_g2_i1.p1  ORF type:complete len:322 (-),score=43.24 TRINITY_DN17367_c0_g2_i1:47-1012(-)